MNLKKLREVDAEVAQCIDEELKRQQTTIGKRFDQQICGRQAAQTLL